MCKNTDWCLLQEPVNLVYSQNAGGVIEENAIKSTNQFWLQ
jgi:hypothetical protein